MDRDSACVHKRKKLQFLFRCLISVLSVDVEIGQVVVSALNSLCTFLQTNSCLCPNPSICTHFHSNLLYWQKMSIFPQVTYLETGFLACYSGVHKSYYTVETKIKIPWKNKPFWVEWWPKQLRRGAFLERKERKCQRPFCLFLFSMSSWNFLLYLSLSSALFFLLEGCL